MRLDFAPVPATRLEARLLARLGAERLHCGVGADGVRQRRADRGVGLVGLAQRLGDVVARHQVGRRQEHQDGDAREQRRSPAIASRQHGDASQHADRRQHEPDHVSEIVS